MLLSGSSAASGDTGNAVSHYMIESGPQALRPADRARILGEVLGRDLRFRQWAQAHADAF